MPAWALAQGGWPQEAQQDEDDVAAAAAAVAAAPHGGHYLRGDPAAPEAAMQQQQQQQQQAPATGGGGNPLMQQLLRQAVELGPAGAAPPALDATAAAAAAAAAVAAAPVPPAAAAASPSSSFSPLHHEVTEFAARATPTPAEVRCRRRRWCRWCRHCCCRQRLHRSRIPSVAAFLAQLLWLARPFSQKTGCFLVLPCVYAGGGGAASGAGGGGGGAQPLAALPHRAVRVTGGACGRSAANAEACYFIAACIVFTTSPRALLPCSLQLCSLPLLCSPTRPPSSPFSPPSGHGAGAAGG